MPTSKRTFSDHSHGFRPGRGCHTALREIYHTWKGTAWIIEGDIADCFGSLNHDRIVSALAEHIQDGRFLGLVEKTPGCRIHGGLEAEQNIQRCSTRLNPEPCALQYSPLATWTGLWEMGLIPQYNKGKKRRENQAYQRLTKRARRLRKKRANGGYQKINSRRRNPLNRPSGPRLSTTPVLPYADDVRHLTH